MHAGGGRSKSEKSRARELPYGAITSRAFGRSTTTSGFAVATSESSGQATTGCILRYEDWQGGDEHVSAGSSHKRAMRQALAVVFMMHFQVGHSMLAACSTRFNIFWAFYPNLVLSCSGPVGPQPM
jgi:hypothetical protein